jgi:hypothetical protein
MFGEFIDFVLFAIVIIYIVRVIARLVLPMLFQKVVNKAQQQQHQQQNYTSNTTTGKIKVDHIPNPKKGSIPDSEGDFVDYEEIK